MVHPLLERELAAIMRGGFRKMSWRILALVMGANSVVWIVSRFVPGPAPFQFLLHFYLALAMGTVLYTTAGAAQGLFSVESQRGTMHLVLLTNTRPWQLVLFKLASPLLTSALLLSLLIPFLLSVAPVTTVPAATLLGGVAFIAGLTLLFTASSAWRSVQSGHTQDRSRVRNLFFGTIYFGPMALFFVAGSLNFHSSWIDRAATLSPIMTGLSAVTGLGTIPPGNLFRCASFMVVAAAVAVGFTGLELRRLGREEASSSEAASMGSGSGRPAFKSEKYPYAGIAATDPKAVRTARLGVVGLAVAWIAVGYATDWEWFVLFAPVVGLAQFTLIFWQSTVSMGRRIADDRRHGMLELLTVAGLAPKNIAVGLGLGAVRQFDSVVRLTTGIWIGFAILGASLPVRSVIGAVLLLLFWAGMIKALFVWRRRPNYTVASLALESGNLAKAIADSNLRSILARNIWILLFMGQSIFFGWRQWIPDPELAFVLPTITVWIWAFYLRTQPAAAAGHFTVLFEALIARDQRPVPPDDSKAGVTPAPRNGKA